MTERVVIFGIVWNLAVMVLGVLGLVYQVAEVIK